MDRMAESIGPRLAKAAKPTACNESVALPMVVSLALDQLVDGNV